MKCENKYCFKVFPPKVSHMAIFTLFHLPLSTSDKKALQNSRVEESQHYHMKDKWTVESITPSKEGREGEERQGRKEGGRERFAPLSADWLCVGDMQSFVCGSVTPSCLTLLTAWTAAHQASLYFTISWSLLRLMSMESVMLSKLSQGFYDSALTFTFGLC